MSRRINSTGNFISRRVYLINVYSNDIIKMKICLFDVVLVLLLLVVVVVEIDITLR